MDLLASMTLGGTSSVRSWVGRLLGTTSHARVLKRLVKNEAFKDLITGYLSGQTLLKKFRAYEVEEEMEPALVVRSLSRSVRVVGRVFLNIAVKAGSNSGKRVAGWVATVGGVGSGLAEVLLPGSWIHLLFRRPFELLAVFGVVLLVLGVLLDAPGAESLGGLLFGIFIVLALLGQRLESAVRTRSLGFGVLRVLFFVLVGALALLGAITLPESVERAFELFREGTAGPGG